MATITATTELDATPEQVWAVFSNPNQFSDWLTIHRTWKGDVPDTFVEGTTVAQVVDMLGMPNTIKWTVDSIEAPRNMVMSGTGMAGVKARFELTVEANGDAGTTATIDSSFEGALVKGALEKAVVMESRKQLDESMANLNGLLSGQPA